jgi:hypothetical protein
MRENVVRGKSFAFSLRVVKLSASILHCPFAHLPGGPGW